MTAALPLPDPRFGMAKVEFDLSKLEKNMPDFSVLEAANKFNEHRYRNLTARQRMFVDAYLGNNFDHEKAALEAGFTAEEAARVGRRMLKKPPILAAIQYALDYFTETKKRKFADVVAEYEKIAFARITDLIDPHTGSTTGLDSEDPKWHAVKKIKITETKYGTNIEYEMHDKMGALDKLGRILNPDAMPRDPNDPVNGGTTVNVQTINIIPVPSGQFLPPLEIEHDKLEFNRVDDQSTP